MSELPTMRGSAIHAVGAGNFEVPLFSHIKDKLWMGCSPSEFPDIVEEPPGHWYYTSDDGEVECQHLMEWDSILLREQPRFEKILNLYHWGKYKVPEGTEMVSEEMYDAYGKVDEEQLERLVELVASWLKQGKKVLVHCQAGLNRSSLVVARVLMKHYGMTSYEAIDHIRSQRSPICLCNKDFEDYLRSLDSWKFANLTQHG